MLPNGKRVLVGIVIAVLGASLANSGCGPKKEKRSNFQGGQTGPIVAVSNYPLGFFVEELVGDQVEVIGPGGQLPCPGEWSPDDDQISKMQAADLVFTVGAAYEKWPQFVSLRQERIVEVSRGMIKDFIAVDGEVHKHGPQGEEHTHTGLANAFWLDPKMGRAIMERIAKAVVEQYPEQAEMIEANRKQLAQRFDVLDQEIENRTAKQPVVYSSDTRFQYLNRRLGSQDIYFFWTSHGKEELPDKAWESIDAKLSQIKAGVMLFPLEPSAATKGELEKRGITAKVVDTIEIPDSSGDYFDRMARVIGELSDKKTR